MNVLGVGFEVNKDQFVHFMESNKELIGRVRGIMNFVIKENPGIFV